MNFNVPISLFIINIFDVICIYQILYTFFEKRDMYKERNWIIILSAPIAWGILTLLNLFCNTIVNAISMNLTVLALIFIFFRPKNPKGYFMYLFYYIASSIYEGIIGLFLTQNLSVDTRAYADLSSAYASFFLCIAKFVTAVLICKFGTKDRDKKMTKVMLIFLFVPVSSILLYYEGITTAPDVLLTGSKYLIGLLTGLVLVFSNVALFFGMEKYTRMYHAAFDAKEQALKAEADSTILSVAAKSMQERLSYNEEMIERDRVMRHDRRHFEGLILSLIKEGNIEEAQKILEERLRMEPRRGRKWCENTTINATLDYYVVKAEVEGVKVEVFANIPNDLSVNELDLAIAIGNLFENAIHGASKVKNGEKYIKLTAKYKSQLLLEIENSCSEEVSFDTEGYPVTKEQGHGVGTKSVLAFVDKTKSQIVYSAKDGIFRVRMIIGS